MKFWCFMPFSLKMLGVVKFDALGQKKAPFRWAKRG
jgi:hypothetical protein